MAVKKSNRAADPTDATLNDESRAHAANTRNQVFVSKLLEEFLRGFVSTGDEQIWLIQLALIGETIGDVFDLDRIARARIGRGMLEPVEMQPWADRGAWTERSAYRCGARIVELLWAAIFRSRRLGFQNPEGLAAHVEKMRETLLYRAGPFMNADGAAFSRIAATIGIEREIAFRTPPDGQLANNPRNKKRAPKGVPGRPITTGPLADFANKRKINGDSWKEIARKWNAKNPQEKVPPDGVQKTWERRYPRKNADEIRT